MTNTNPTPEKSAANSDQASKLNAKIKEAYNKLNDDDVKLYSSNKDQFFAKLKEKQSVSKEDGQKKIQEIEKACDAACSSEKTSNVKAA